MRLIRIFLVLILFSLCYTSNATVDYLAVNHLTKELYVYEEESYQGIFWITIAGEEKNWNQNEKLYLNKGYTYTKNPYKSEYILTALFISIAGFVIARRKITLNK
jgi:hypothetical protein